MPDKPYTPLEAMQAALETGDPQQALDKLKSYGFDLAPAAEEAKEPSEEEDPAEPSGMGEEPQPANPPAEGEEPPMRTMADWRKRAVKRAFPANGPG